MTYMLPYNKGVSFLPMTYHEICTWQIAILNESWQVFHRCSCTISRGCNNCLAWLLFWKLKTWKTEKLKLQKLKTSQLCIQLTIFFSGPIFLELFLSSATHRHSTEHSIIESNKQAPVHWCERLNMPYDILRNQATVVPNEYNNLKLTLAIQYYRRLCQSLWNIQLAVSRYQALWKLLHQTHYNLFISRFMHTYIYIYHINIYLLRHRWPMFKHSQYHIKHDKIWIPVLQQDIKQSLYFLQKKCIVKERFSIFEQMNKKLYTD